MQSGKRKHIAKKVLLLAFSLCLLSTPSQEPAWADNAKPAIDTSAPKSITTGEELERWMDFYYLHPQPELLSEALHFADSTNMVKQGEAPLTAFVSRIFAQNPKRIPGWVVQLQDLTPASKPMLWNALWWSNTIEGKEQLNKLATTLPQRQEQDAILSQMAKPSQPIEQIELNRPEVLDELWGAFTATGDEKYVNRLISTLPWLTDNSGDYIKLTIAGAAKWSLVSNAQIHPKVMTALMKARQDDPNSRHTLDQIIAEATKGLANSTNQQRSAAAGNQQQASTPPPQ